MNASRKLLTVNELASLLGVPKSWIYRRTSLNEIPHLKLGTYVKFDLEKIEQWLESKERGV
jgi:excisionase family DNA binding protein